MTLIGLLITLLVICIIFYLLKAYIVPLLPQTIGIIVLAIFAVVVILWLLSIIGLIPMGEIRFH